MFSYAVLGPIMGSGRHGGEPLVSSPLIAVAILGGIFVLVIAFIIWVNKNH